MDKQNENGLLSFKREQFRVKIRRDNLEDMFTAKRKSQLKIQYQQLEIPQFQSIQELHKYLISGEHVKDKLFSVAENKALLNNIYNGAVAKDYYSLLIICNITYVKQEQGFEDIFIDAIQYGLKRQALNFISTGLQGLENFLGQFIQLPILLKLQNGGLLKLLCTVCTEIKNTNSIFTLEETAILNGSIRTAVNYICQFQLPNLREYAIELAKDQNIIQLFNVCQQIIKIHLDDTSNQCKCLNLLFQILKLNKKVLEHINNETIKTVAKLLSVNNVPVRIVSLKLLILISYDDNEAFVQRMIIVNALDDIKRLIYNEDQYVRTFCYHALSNIANCATDSIKQEIASDDTFTLEIVNIFRNMNSETVDINLLYLIYGIFVNCQYYLADEFVQDSNILQFIYNKLQSHLEDRTEAISLYIKLIASLIIVSHVDTKSCNIQIIVEKYINHEDNGIVKLTNELLKFMDTIYIE